MDTFRRDGLTFDVRDSGGAATGSHEVREQPTVVLLHGFPQDGSAFDAVTPLLVEAGLRVLAPDQRGYSPGARPTGRKPYVLRELVDDVVALLDQAGVERAHVVGHDWGGAVAWAFASRRSERTASLTVLSTPHPAAMQAAMLHGQARRSSYMLWFQVPCLPERHLLRDDGAALRRALLRSGLAADRVEHYAARLLGPGALTAALAWYRALPVGRGFGVGRIHVPTVFVHGRQDPFFAPHGIEATPAYVRAPFRSEALEAGHWIPETRPDDVAQAVLSLVQA